MFPFTKKVDYALLMLDALSNSDRVLSLREIATQKGVPLRFLSRIAVDLKKSGVVASREGRGGGYFLTRNLSEISLAEFLGYLDGPWGITRCRLGNRCQSWQFCSIREPLSQLEAQLHQFLGSIRVSDLIAKRRSQRG